MISNVQAELVNLLRYAPKDNRIHAFIKELESVSSADIIQNADLLAGVWELRWSSSSQPWLRQAPWLENLQALDPELGRGMNLLRLKGLLSGAAAITVQADLNIVDIKRVDVRFRRGGWVGPQLPGWGRLKLLKAVKQSFPAWLDITFLDEQLRICRGNAGTVFALIRRDDLCLDQLLKVLA